MPITFALLVACMERSAMRDRIAASRGARISLRSIRATMI
jgi:hypothetical protein